jgi:sec-independent protein translocase protein TatC
MCIGLMIWPGPSRIYDIHRRADDRFAAGRLEDDRHRRDFAVPGADEGDAGDCLILALPWVLYQLWAFVAPGLYAHEKRLIAPLVISSSVLFMAGVAFCYFLVFGRVFQFIAEFSPQSIAVTPDIENYLDFVMSMCLAFGATFEVPVVVVILVRMGLVSVAKLKEIRPYAIVGAFVLPRGNAAGCGQMFSLAIPMCLLFEAGHAGCALIRAHVHGAGRESLSSR